VKKDGRTRKNAGEVRDPRFFVLHLIFYFISMKKSLAVGTLAVLALGGLGFLYQSGAPGESQLQSSVISSPTAPRAIGNSIDAYEAYVKQFNLLATIPDTSAVLTNNPTNTPPNLGLLRAGKSGEYLASTLGVIGGNPNNTIKVTLRHLSYPTTGTPTTPLSQIEELRTNPSNTYGGDWRKLVTAGIGRTLINYNVIEYNHLARMNVNGYTHDVYQGVNLNNQLVSIFIPTEAGTISVEWTAVRNRVVLENTVQYTNNMEQVREALLKVAHAYLAAYPTTVSLNAWEEQVITRPDG
jgi:hypothetical protein